MSHKCITRPTGEHKPRATLRPFLVAAFFLARIVTASGEVVINEIMYQPASGNLLESYVELRNTGAIATNLSGCRFTKGIQFTFSTNTVLAPSAYLVVAANGTAFANKYPGVTNFVAGFFAPIPHHLRFGWATGQHPHENQNVFKEGWA